MSILHDFYRLLFLIAVILAYGVVLAPILYFTIKKALVDAHNEIEMKKGTRTTGSQAN